MAPTSLGSWPARPDSRIEASTRAWSRSTTAAEPLQRAVDHATPLNRPEVAQRHGAAGWRLRRHTHGHTAVW